MYWEVDFCVRHEEQSVLLVVKASNSSLSDEIGCNNIGQEIRQLHKSSLGAMLDPHAVSNEELGTLLGFNSG